MSLEKYEIKNILERHGLLKNSEIFEIQKLDNSANETFVIKIEKILGYEEKVFMKIYTASEGRAVKNCEIWIREMLPPVIAVSSILGSGCYKNNDYLITTYIEGETLLQKIKNSSLWEEQLIDISTQLKILIHSCGEIPIKGFGSLDEESKNGQHETFTIFLEANIRNAYRLFESANITNNSRDNAEIKTCITKYCDFLNAYLEEYTDYFNQVASKLIPLDLNLNNFIISPENKIFMADLESFAGGDFLLAFGELYSHIYLSPFSKFFDSEYKKFSEEEQRHIHFYALLGCFNIFCFCAANKVPYLKEVGPWGNPHSFMDLMKAHEEKIELYRPTMAFRR